MKSFSVVLAVAMLLIGTAAMAADTTPQIWDRAPKSPGIPPEQAATGGSTDTATDTTVSATAPGSTKTPGVHPTNQANPPAGKSE
jgi:hypothetical protein